MDVREAITTRLSIRQYEEASVPDAHLETLFRALQQAPSASNRQNWEFVFAGDPELKQQLSQACMYQGFVAQCSYLIAAVVDPRQKWHQVDISIALTNFTLQAAELGYGTCWIGAFDEHRVKELLGIPNHKKVLVCMAFGKPGGRHVPKSRKAIEDFIYLDGYGSPFQVKP
ncbi:MAG: nitroreductase family protein [Deltaproteobacteria bacterium]|nr:nitroreductase family protein [Deltaproteobacteria bacterium]MBW2141972.1 nitroreductase family protein [Deltaproteobacteria bacterium]